MKSCLLTMAVGFLIVPHINAESKEQVKIGIPRSIFRDVPPALLTFANQPFKDLMMAQTGLSGDIVNDADAMNIAKMLTDGKLQLAVLLGHEYAWAKNKYPELDAIVCAVPKPKEVQAFILVRHDCKGSSLADMKGSKLVIPSGLRDHAKLFFEKRKSEEMGTETFCSIVKSGTVHDSIHKLIEGDADVTVTDAASWSYFQKLYPGPAQNVKVMAKSDVFPPTVVVYKKGGISAETLEKFREGMLTAHKNSKGQKMMTTIKMERFDSLPSNYNEMVTECLKNYPLPLRDRAMIDK